MNDYYVEYEDKDYFNGNSIDEVDYNIKAHVEYYKKAKGDVDFDYFDKNQITGDYIEYITVELIEDVVLGYCMEGNSSEEVYLAINTVHKKLGKKIMYTDSDAKDGKLDGVSKVPFSYKCKTTLVYILQ